MFQAGLSAVSPDVINLSDLVIGGNLRGPRSSRGRVIELLMRLRDRCGNICECVLPPLE